MPASDLCAYLSEVGLCAADYIGREVNASLSGGELKRIEIAMLMARGVELSLFDEPEAGIDLWSFQNLIRVFEHIRDQKHGAVVIISHQERILGNCRQDRRHFRRGDHRVGRGKGTASRAARQLERL